jgi:hypothetical protein
MSNVLTSAPEAQRLLAPRFSVGMGFNPNGTESRRDGGNFLGILEIFDQQFKS